MTQIPDNPHITGAADAEQEFWLHRGWRDSPLGRQSQRLEHIVNGSVLVIGYAPSVLLAVCENIANQTLQPALVIGMPIDFSHAPAAKRKLMHSNIPFITVKGTLGGGLLAAVVLNAIAESLIEKPDCHCYLEGS